MNKEMLEEIIEQFPEIEFPMVTEIFTFNEDGETFLAERYGEIDVYCIYQEGKERAIFWDTEAFRMFYTGKEEDIKYLYRCPEEFR